jgi:hypothetical protein
MGSPQIRTHYLHAGVLDFLQRVVLAFRPMKQVNSHVRLFFFLRFFQRTASRMQAPNSG